MEPKHKIGHVVKVYDYYADGDIVRDVYYGLIVDIKSYHFNQGRSAHFIYQILPNDAKNRTDDSAIQTAEEFALEAVEMG